MVLEVYKKDKGPHGDDLFYQPCREALNRIISMTGCEIIISSGWRRFYDLEQIREIFEWNRIIKIPIGFTQDYDGQTDLPKGKEVETIRCREILSWLGAHDANGRISWCAVDDMDLSFGLDKFVRCPDHRLGLSYKGAADKVISILNGTA